MKKGKGRLDQSEFVEGRDSYAAKYHRVMRASSREHHSLVRIVECDDHLFYELETDEKLKAIGLGGYSEVIFQTADEDIDFTKDPRTSLSGKVNAGRRRPEGLAVTGCTSVIKVGEKRRTIVFMRRETGKEDTEEMKCALKLSALFHELGHVDDFEKGINWNYPKFRVVDAEIYAHRYACAKLIQGKHSLLLGYYLDGLNDMAKSDSEYVRKAAQAVIDSPDFQRYKAAVSPNYGSG